MPGLWTLHRTIGAATLEGTATFTPHDDALLWHEHGTLRLADGSSFAAERTYLLRPNGTGFTVYFPETPPRLFHDVILHAAADGSRTGHADHQCSADHYATRYDFHAAGGFTVRHRVTGPRKEYDSLSRYARP